MTCLTCSVDVLENLDFSFGVMGHDVCITQTLRKLFSNRDMMQIVNISNLLLIYHFSTMIRDFVKHMLI